MAYKRNQKRIENSLREKYRRLTSYLIFSIKTFAALKASFTIAASSNSPL
jgi:hypothetical protein